MGYENAEESDNAFISNKVGDNMVKKELELWKRRKRIKMQSDYKK